MQQTKQKKERFLISFTWTAKALLEDSFLPLALLYQYKRLANWYFLVLSILGAIPGITPWSPVTQITPTVFVLMVAVVREGVEDYMRYRADRHTN